MSMNKVDVQQIAMFAFEPFRMQEFAFILPSENADQSVLKTPFPQNDPALRPPVPRSRCRRLRCQKELGDILSGMIRDGKAEFVASERPELVRSSSV